MRQRHQRTCGARVRYDGDRRPYGAVGVRRELHRQTRRRRGGHGGLGRPRRTHPGPGPARPDRPPHRPLHGAPPGRRIRCRIRCRGRYRGPWHLAPLRPARGAQTPAVPGGGPRHHRGAGHPRVRHPARPHRRRRRPHVLHRPAGLRPDDRRVRPRLQRAPHRRHRPNLRTGLTALGSRLARPADFERRVRNLLRHAADADEGRRRPARHRLLGRVPAERGHHGPREPARRRHPARGGLRHRRQGLCHRDDGRAGRLPRHRREAGCR